MRQRIMVISKLEDKVENSKNKQEKEKIFEQIMKENFPSLAEEIDF